MSTIQMITGKGRCDAHGDYEFKGYQSGKRVVGAFCPQCAQARQAQMAIKNIESERRLQAQRWDEILRHANIPLAFRGATFENYVRLNEQAQTNAEGLLNYAARFDKVLQTSPTIGVVMYGFPGTGKTHLGCALIKQLLLSGYTARYASLPVLLTQLRQASRGEMDDNLSTMMRELSEVHFLVLDEYGTHTRTEVDYQNLFQIIDARYQRNLPTALITNIELKTLMVEMDERMLERFIGKFTPKLAFSWQSWRKDPGMKQGVQNNMTSAA